MYDYMRICIYIYIYTLFSVLGKYSPFGPHNGTKNKTYCLFRPIAWAWFLITCLFILAYIHT